MDYRVVSAADVGVRQPNGPRPPGQPGSGPARPGAGLARPGGEHAPSPGRDATLLAVVPIPGTGTSLAIVGYVIATPAAGPAADPAPAAADDGLRLDHAQRRVRVEGREVQLTHQEFELLAFLSAHPAIVFTRAELVERVWQRSLGTDGRPVARDSRTVDVHVSRVRRKLGLRYGQCLVTEYRVGYRYRPRPA
jgi:Transcriptional regulatory protein, C terminal